MNNPRYQQLLGCLLDDELTVRESEELIEWLRADPTACAEVRKHLQIWELYSQQVRAERSCDAFTEACRTRLLAEIDEREFVRETERRLRQSARPADGSVSNRLSALAQRVTRWLPSPRWALAAVAVVVCVFVLPGLFRTQGVPELASFTGTGIQILRGNQSVAAQKGVRLQLNDVIRTTGEGEAVISYGREATRIELKSNTEIQFLTWRRGKRFKLTSGNIAASVARQGLFKPMLITTPQAEAKILGTKFSLLTTAEATTLAVTEGKVRFTRTSDRTNVFVSAGNYAVATSNSVLAALPLTGAIFREYWTNIPGAMWPNLITHTNYPDRPDGSDYLTNLSSFEMPSNWADNYGERLRGFVHPPKTGEYIFLVAAKNTASLWLSPDENPENKVQMAFSSEAAPRDWQRVALQQSGSVPLIAGKKYYFEVLHKAGVGDDSLAVAWQGPGREREVIPIQFLSPFKPKEMKR